MKRIFAAILFFLILLCVPVTAGAMEEVGSGFEIRNSYKKDITVRISSENDEQTMNVKAGQTAYADFRFDEPGVYTYTVSRVNAEEQDPVYVIRFFVESDENGALQVGITAEKEGSEAKPEEILFGPEKEILVAKTGDVSDIWLFAGFGLAAVLAAAVMTGLALRRKNGKTKKKT